MRAKISVLFVTNLTSWCQWYVRVLTKENAGRIFVLKQEWREREGLLGETRALKTVRTH